MQGYSGYSLYDGVEFDIHQMNLPRVYRQRGIIRVVKGIKTKLRHNTAKLYPIISQKNGIVVLRTGFSRLSRKCIDTSTAYMPQLLQTFLRLSNEMLYLDEGRRCIW